MYKIGDKVTVEGSGEGTVKIPTGPNGTIGVLMDGKLSMFNGDDVKPLTEGVLGMTMMPDLTRMRELAGLEAPTAPPPAPTVNPAPVADVACDHMTTIMQAIETIKCCLPEIKLADAKQVRVCLSELFTILNESSPYSKGLQAYIREQDELMTVGKTSNDVVDHLAARMGTKNKADAQKAFNAMRKDGKLKQKNGAFQMDAMGDDELKANATLAMKESRRRK